MTLPSFQGVGTASATAPTWPTHVTDDFAILACEYPASTLSAPSGWTAFPNMPILNAVISGTRLSCFYRFATSSSESAPSIVGPADHVWGVIATYRGVNKSTPFHALASGWCQGSTALNIAANSITTIVDDCMIVHAIAWNIDNAGPLSSGQTNALLANLTERYDGGTTTGDGGGIVIIDGEKATKGYCGMTSFQFSTASSPCFMVVALQAADKTLPILKTKTQIINTHM